MRMSYGEGQPVNAGGRRYDGPFGTVYATNITPDAKTGIGGWTDTQIVEAIRSGRRPNGERLIPVHPYTDVQRHGRAGSQGAGGLPAHAARRSTAPTNPRRSPCPSSRSVFLPAWLAAFSPRETPPATAPTSGVARGEYLVRAVAHCGECHTPRGMTQAVDNSRFLAGNPRGPENSVVPNITPDKATGIGDWSEEDLAEYLATGNKPDGDVSVGPDGGGHPRHHGRLQGSDQGRPARDRPIPEVDSAHPEQGPEAVVITHSPEEAT